nr:DUF3139 domain-containing protein [Paenibacillus yonginensis]
MFFSISLFLFILIFLFVYYQSFSFKNEVSNYLIHDKGFSSNEVKKITTHISKAPVISASVIFSDEPSARYFYKKERGQFIQYSCAPVKGINLEYKYKHCENP